MFIFASLSPVYAGFVFSESTSIKSKTAETTTVDIRNPLEQVSFLDRCKSSELEEHHHFDHPTLHRNDQHNPIRKPTIVDGEEWDIIVPDDYSTIQKAIDNADMGNRIFVRAGTYNENVEIDIQSLTLHGEDREFTFIDGNGKGNVIMVTSSADGVNISGFTIHNSEEISAGINISSHYNIIQDTILKNNNNGISLYYSSGNQIEKNIIINNKGDGIWLHRSSGNDIKENILTENEGNGIGFTYSSLGTTVEDNTISTNVNCGILITESSLGNTVKGNTIENNDVGVKCIGVSDGNIFHHNSFIGNNQNACDSSMDLWDYNSGGNYWDDYDGVDKDGDGIGDKPYNISGGENQDRFPLMNPAFITEKPFEQEAIKETNSYSKDEKPAIDDCSTNNEWDIVVPDDYQSIQEAVDHANEGYRILVRPDVYYENIVIDLAYLTLHGENRDSTVIDGGGIPTHIVSIKAPGVEVSGFTICNAGGGYSGVLGINKSALISGCIVNNCTFGISLFLFDDNTVTNNSMTGNDFGINICNSRNNHIANNVIEGNGEGIVSTGESTADFFNNTVRNNIFNGLLLINHSNSIIKGNVVEDNSLDKWFGIQLMYNSLNNIIEENIIRNNSHDGISFSKSSNNILTNNTLSNNGGSGVSFWFQSDGNHIIERNEIKSNDYGIWLHFSCKNAISNNHIIKNQYDGIFLTFSINNTISGNTISNNIYGIELSSSSNFNNVSKNNISNNEVGIGSDQKIYVTASGNIIYGNNIYNNSDGIYMDEARDNVISSNNISFSHGKYGFHQGDGIYLSDSFNNKVYGNKISDNVYGVTLEDCSQNNMIFGNSISNSTYYGIFLWSRCNSNTVRSNNLINNSCFHASFAASFNNHWDGNYWDNWFLKFPKPILGSIGEYFLLRIWPNFDWFPAKEPYDIGG